MQMQMMPLERDERCPALCASLVCSSPRPKAKLQQSKQRLPVTRKPERSWLTVKRCTVQFNVPNPCHAHPPLAHLYQVKNFIWARRELESRKLGSTANGWFLVGTQLQQNARNAKKFKLNQLKQLELTCTTILLACREPRAST